MMSGLLFPFGLVLFVLASPITGQVDPNCNYSDDISDGAIRYVYSPGYPQNYKGKFNCKWQASSNYRIRLKCSNFSLPPSYNCNTNSLAVTINKNETKRYCGRTTEQFTVESTGPNMTITFTSAMYSMGKFQCELQQIQRPIDNENCECGWKKPTRIVGGMETGVNEYPMMAGIVDITRREVSCGACIISNWHVLTAAHCMADKLITETAVLIGDHDLSTGADTNASRLLLVEKIIIHPKYSSVRHGFDIAVVKVKEAIVYSGEVGPVCLPFQHSADSFGGVLAVALGWGTLDFTGSRSDSLMQVQLNVISKRQCSKTFKDIDDSQLCTQTEGKDTCQFDSGGPLLWQNPTTIRNIQIGITSYGIGCGGDTPGVYTRVGSFVSWIQSVTPEVSYCQVE